MPLVAGHSIPLNTRMPNMVWLGVGLAIAFWLTESLVHTFVFNDGPLSDTLLAEHDPNEVWMRIVVAALFVAFGWIAEKSVRAERRVRFETLRLNHVLQFLDHVMHGIHHRVEPRAGSPFPDATPQLPAAAAATGSALRLEDLELGEQDVSTLARFLQDLSSFVDDRFKELYALLQLTHEINMGLLLDEVLDKAYETLRQVLPYHRIGVALIEDGGRIARAHWARSDGAELQLGNGFAAPLKGSSLQKIIESGEPRIINDLGAYFEAHPQSESTRRMMAEGIRSSLTCPLISSGKPIGFMFFSSRTPNTYKDAHVEIFKLIAGHLSVVLEKSNLYQQILREKEKSEQLLLNVMPPRIAARLRGGEQMVAEHLPEINIVFADIVGFTEFAGRNAPQDVVNLLQDVFVRFDRLCDRFHVEKIKTIGDEYMAMTGSFRGDSLRNLADFALAVLGEIEGAHYPDGQPLRVRVGMHTGPAVAGVIGQKKYAYDIWGDAVNIASRMESSGEPGRIHVTGEVYARLRDDFRFEERGVVEIKGKGPMKTYFLVGKN